MATKFNILPIFIATFCANNLMIFLSLIIGVFFIDFLYNKIFYYITMNLKL